MLKFILAVATALFGIDGRVRHPDFPRLDWPEWQRQSRGCDDAIATARRALDGVDHPFML